MAGKTKTQPRPGLYPKAKPAPFKPSPIKTVPVPKRKP
jgi:hypothetical protein